MDEEVTAMTLQEIISDIHALNEDIEAYERKYGVLSETFYESYTSGEEPEDESWVMDWADWAGAYKILLRRKEQYRRAIQALREHSKTLVGIIKELTLPVPYSILL
jgi:cell division protein FtsB